MLSRLARRAVCALVAAAVLGCSSRPGQNDVPGTATVTLVARWSLDDAIVVFQRPDREVAQVVFPDPFLGTATGEVVSGSTVTIGRFRSSWTGEWRLTTIASVEPGDALVLSDGAITLSREGTVTATLPGSAAGAANYEIDIGCTTIGLPDLGAPFELRFACPPSVAALDMIATAVAASGKPIAYATALEVPFGAIARPGPWHEVDAVSLGVTNAPPGAASVDAWLEPQPRPGGVRYPFTHSYDAVGIDPDGSATFTLAFAPEFASTARRSVRLSYSDGLHPIAFAQHVVNEAPIASATIDLAAAMLPPIYDAQLVTTGATTRATWSPAAEEPSIDGQILRVRWSATDGDRDWQVVLPPGRTSFTFPALPAELGAYLPPAGATNAGLTVTAYDVSDAGSYSDFKRDHLGLLGGLPDSGRWTLRSSHSAPPAP